MNKKIQVSQNNSTNRQKERLYYEIAKMQEQWKSIADKLDALEREQIIETHADETFRLEQKIIVMRERLQQVEQHLEYLEFQTEEFENIKEYPNPKLNDEPRESELPSLLNEKIIKFLGSIPNIHDSKTQQMLVYGAGLDNQLQNQITFTGSSGQFLQLFVKTLNDYGILTDGRNALKAVLESTKSYVGQDKREYCDKLIKALQQYKQE